jgi:hypothetical protein
VRISYRSKQSSTSEGPLRVSLERYVFSTMGVALDSLTLVPSSQCSSEFKLSLTPSPKHGLHFKWVQSLHTSSKWLTEKASWNSKASISFMVNPAFSRTFGVAYVGLKKKKKVVSYKFHTFCFLRQSLARLAWSLWSSCLSLPSVGITGTYHHAQLSS